MNKFYKVQMRRQGVSKLSPLVPLALAPKMGLLCSSGFLCHR